LSVQVNLQEMERTREHYWRAFPNTSPIKLHWRAMTLRHCFQILPQESVLELGAGAGVWTEHLASVFRGENPITAAVFNDDLASAAAQRFLPNVDVRLIQSGLDELPAESYDYIVGTAILCHDLYEQNLRALLRLLKPGGQILFFEANFWNPQVFMKSVFRTVGQWAGNARCQVGMRKYRLMHAVSRAGFTNIEIIPYDLIHSRTPRALVKYVRDLAFVLEHAPVLRDLCGTLYIWAKKPGDDERPRPGSLATRAELYRSTSVVVPCHNEEMNVGPLVETLMSRFGPYIHEIILVNDNSRDQTAAIIRDLATRYPVIKLVDRQGPGGVGLALRDGYAAAAGELILSIDCDFARIAQDFRDLFDAVADGFDGAVGSRFSHDSVLINYPLPKIVCNRAFHVLANLLLPVRVRDISNNLKLMRAAILKNIPITERHFAANVETGLRPILAGYKIVEVPVSWINRTADMGQSSFRLVSVAPDYFRALLRIVRERRLSNREAVRLQGRNEVPGARVE
jgi:SAM-dependent methyltransferase